MRNADNTLYSEEDETDADDVQAQSDALYNGQDAEQATTEEIAATEQALEKADLGTPTLEQAITEALTRAANQNKENANARLDAMRALAGKLLICSVICKSCAAFHFVVGSFRAS